MTEHAASGFSFAKIIVGDLEQVAGFYKAVLGLCEVMRFETDTVRGRISEVILANTPEMSTPTLAIYKYLDKPPPTDTDSILGFVVDDVKAIVAKARAAGVEIIEDFRPMPEVGVSVAFVADPEGRMVELVEYLQ